MQHRTVPLGTGLPAIGADEWCHRACYERWEWLTLPTQVALGAHIHYDPADDCWTEPFPVVLLRPVSDHGVA